MSFHRPLLLFLLALPVFWIATLWSRAGIPLLMPFDYTRGGRGEWLRRLTSAFECLPAVLLACAIIILAGPRRPAPPKDQRILNNVILLVDVSMSMETQIAGGKTRFETAMEAARAFCSRREGDAFGLSIFGMDFLHWFPPTKDLSALKNALQFIQPKQLPRSFAGTFIANALRNCVPRMNATKEGDRAIILLTDGESSDIKAPKDLAVIAALRAQNITVFAIMLSEEQIEPALVGIARATGGEVFNAATPEALQTVFKSIDAMKKVVVLEKQPQVADYYDPLFVPAIALLAFSVLTLFGLRFTPW